MKREGEGTPVGEAHEAESKGGPTANPATGSAIRRKQAGAEGPAMVTSGGQTYAPGTTPRLWTRNYVAACMGNFLLCLAFYLLLPMLPIYLEDVFQTSKSAVGVILSCYTVAALCVRPFSGYILDRFQRKPIYVAAFAAFTLVFMGYAWTTALWLFVVLRVVHGFTFGLVTTAGNTVAVDVIPSPRRGEGIGYYGIFNNLAMSVGPMVSLFLASGDGSHDYGFIFRLAFAIGAVGVLTVATIRPPPKPRADPAQMKARTLHAYDRFFLVEGFRAGGCLLLMAVPYGITMTFVAIYARESGVDSGQGVFFSLMAVGLIASRLFAGKLVDRGLVTKVIVGGSVVCGASFYLLAALGAAHGLLPVAVRPMFFAAALLLGVGFGLIFPAYNTLFVNLAPNNRRATASSTYLTSWDLGIGGGLVLGGRVADLGDGLAPSFIAGAVSFTVAAILFAKVAAPHFNAHKLR